jgi:hypothetical protein
VKAFKVQGLRWHMGLHDLPSRVDAIPVNCLVLRGKRPSALSLPAGCDAIEFA